MNQEMFEIISSLLARAPRCVRQDLPSTDHFIRTRDEEALAAM